MPFLLDHGLEPSTCQVYASAQRQFLEFCSQDNPLEPCQPLLAASEKTLMRFRTHLPDDCHHSSIKVYLSAVRSLHIHYSYPDPLTNGLQHQHLLRGIKQHQESNLLLHQPVTADLLSVLSLDFTNFTFTVFRFY